MSKVEVRAKFNSHEVKLSTPENVSRASCQLFHTCIPPYENYGEQKTPTPDNSHLKQLSPRQFPFTIIFHPNNSYPRVVQVGVAIEPTFVTSTLFQEKHSFHILTSYQYENIVLQKGFL